MGLACHNSYLEVDLSIICKNIQSISSSLPPSVELVPVLKCDAYGMGALPVALALVSACPIKTIALAQIGEGVELRRAGLGQALLVMGGFAHAHIPIAVEHDLTLTIFRPETAILLNHEAKRQGKRVSVQIKIETGLHRIGAKPGEELGALIDTLLALEHIEVTGAFTHFVEGEIPGNLLARKQLALYLEAVKQLEDAGIPIKMKHICNSGASDWFTDACLDAVRIGRRLYMDNRDAPLSSGTPGAVEEPLSWRTSIINLRTLLPGETVGYDQMFTAQRPTEVATICIGYGDGLCEQLVKANSPLLVGEKLAHYIGICMDQSFVDVTGLGCQIGDEVTIFGRSSRGSVLSVQQLAKTVDHEGVYFTSLLSPRVERRYIGGN